MEMLRVHMYIHVYFIFDQQLMCRTCHATLHISVTRARAARSSVDFSGQTRWACVARLASRVGHLANRGSLGTLLGLPRTGNRSRQPCGGKRETRGRADTSKLKRCERAAGGVELPVPVEAMRYPVRGFNMRPDGRLRKLSFRPPGRRGSARRLVCGGERRNTLLWIPRRRKSKNRAWHLKLWSLFLPVRAWFCSFPICDQ